MMCVFGFHRWNNFTRWERCEILFDGYHPACRGCRDTEAYNHFEEQIPEETPDDPEREL